jgi:hypothetical protein
LCTKQLEISYNSDATIILKDIEQGRGINLDQANIALWSGATQIEPKNFEQALSHNDPRDQEKWRMAIKEGFNDLDSKKVWKIIKKKITQKEEEKSNSNSNSNGSLRSKETEFSEPDSLHADIFMFRV